MGLPLNSYFSPGCVFDYASCTATRRRFILSEPTIDQKKNNRAYIDSGPYRIFWRARGADVPGIQRIDPVPFR